GPVPNRTTGDLRLTFYQNGNNPISLADASLWTSGATANTGSWGAIPLAGFNGATNQVTGVTDLTGAPLSAIYTFAEVSINLSALFPSASGRCSGDYGFMNLRSASSPSPTSSLADWVRPIALSVPSTCASVVVNKAWSVDGTTYANGSQPPGFT